MLSLTQFRQHCMPIFKLMRDTKMEMEIVYKGVVYDMSIRKTDKVPVVTRTKRKQPEQIRNIEVLTCPECSSLLFNRVCMNSQCIHATGLVGEALDALEQQLAPPLPE